MVTIHPLKRIPPRLELPGDKSISHRAVMLSSLCEGETKISNFLSADDTLITLSVFKKLGVRIVHDKKKKNVLIKGKGKYLKSGSKILYMGESGTTMRLIAGLLSAQKFESILTCSPSLAKRPMKRVTQPLGMMGADVKAKIIKNEKYPPLRLKPVDTLSGISYLLPVASAQVKSCLLLAGLYAKGKTIIDEPYISRDHTERMLKLFRASIKVNNKKISIRPSDLESPGKIFIPSDFSSAAYFISLALLGKKSNLLLKRVLINPTRTGLLKVLKRMNAYIRFKNINRKNYEPYADILVKSSKLKAAKVRENEVPLMIDELPLLFVLASYAKGVTTIYGLKELKVKETDRIKSMEYNLKKMGVDFITKSYLNSKGEEDFLVKITGPAQLKPVKIKSFSDHRTAMSLIVAQLASGFAAKIDDVSCISKSFPEFLHLLKASV